MKDLKHLIYFENLLQSAHNDAVKAAIDKGGIAVGYTCYFMPEVLLNVDNCFSVRLRAPRTGSMDIATYYMSSFLCGFSKALLERGIEGGYNFLSCLMGSETCSEMNRTLEHFEILKLVPNDKFFVSIIDAPFKITEHGLKHYTNQIRIKVLDRLHEVYGVDVSDEALRKAVEEHNRVARVIRAIGEYRKEENPRITGYEYHVLSVASYCCPKAEGMVMLIRSMAPQVIAVDEIGTSEDIHAIEYAMQCGCKLIASVHGLDMDEAKKKPVLGELIRRRMFERYVVLGNGVHPGEIRGIYDERGSVLCRE